MSTVSTIHTLFKNYRKDMRDIWESFNLVSFYMQKANISIQNNNEEYLQMFPLYSRTLKTYSKEDTQGAIQHLIALPNRRRTLIQAVSTFEHFVSRLVFMVYLDFPNKLDGQDSKDSKERETKLIRIILSSATKDEMLEKIIEEKIRGIFYGNPVEFFEKDKAQLGFNNHFKINFGRELNLYKEVTARRNILIHNDGKVDRKYLREVNNPVFALDRRVTLTDEYLRGAVSILEGLSSELTSVVIERIYNDAPQGKLSSSRKSFQKAVRNNFYESLLSHN